MLTVGDKFPAFTLQGINSNNDFVEVGIRDDEQPMPWQPKIDLQARLLGHHCGGDIYQIRKSVAK